MSLNRTFDPPPAYQWQFNGTNLVNGGGVSGSTTMNLSLTNVQLVHDGLYTVVASDAIGSVTSQPAALRIPSLTTIGGSSPNVPQESSWGRIVRWQLLERPNDSA